jgi:hypothetical protein
MDSNRGQRTNAAAGCAGLGCDAGCSTPEYYGVDFKVQAAEDPSGAAPQTCAKHDYYDVNSANPHGGVAPETDDDDVKGDDANCAAIPTDTDQDGVANAPDNCPTKDNPGQIDRDHDS